jgi:Domain of unknown function (DUF5753)
MQDCTPCPVLSLFSISHPGVQIKIAYEESTVGGRLVEVEDVVQALSDLHDRLRSQALDDEASLALITQLSQQ